MTGLGAWIGLTYILGIFPIHPSRGSWPVVVEGEFVWIAQLQLAVAPFVLGVDRGEQTAGSVGVRPAIVPWTVQAKPPELVCGCTSAVKYPACNRKREYGSLCRSSDTSDPTRANCHL